MPIKIIRRKKGTVTEIPTEAPSQATSLPQEPAQEKAPETTGAVSWESRRRPSDFVPERREEVCSDCGGRRWPWWGIIQCREMDCYGTYQKPTEPKEG